ncbi:MAG: VOC family protein [Anaerovoracaceae bacterium]|jgi:catechol 2,3-dioxygenase-like lactoylglutathione lyase family enzyme
MSMIVKMHHVALRAQGEERMEEAIRFYRDVLGLKLIRRWGEGKKAGCMMDAGNAIVEMFADAEPGRTDGPVDHFAFQVDDVDRCAQAAAAAGYGITEGPKDSTIPTEPKPVSIRFAFCRGPVGESIEFYHEY